MPVLQHIRLKITTELSPVTAPLLVYIKLASQLVVSYLYAIILIRNLIFSFKSLRIASIGAWIS